MLVLKDELTNAKRIAIFTHVVPDADAICSSLALQKFINENSYQKQVDIFIDGEIGEKYDPATRNEIINPTPCNHYDLAIVLDCPTLDRIGQNKDFALSIEKIINIDHHTSNEQFGGLNIVSQNSSSTCEILYFIAKGLNWELNDDTAKLIYQGIITDTNGFTSFSMTKRTHQVCSDLLHYNFDESAIKQHYFKSNSIAKVMLQSAALKSLEQAEDGLISTMKISYKDIKKNEATFEDTLGIVELGINIEGTEVCAIFIEKEPGSYYVSLRSKDKVDVSEIAQEFNGGGHKNMAAFSFEGSLKDIEKKLIASIAPRLEGFPRETKIEDIKF